MTNTELLNVLKIMIGSLEAEAMYVGSNLIWNSIPYDSRIEYLQSTGIQYIDTLFKQKDVEKFSIKYFSDNSDQPGYGNAMGCRQSSNNNEFQVTNYSSSISIGARNGNMGNDAHQINEIIYTGGNTISVNGITKNIYNVTILTLDDTIVLFGIRLAGIPTQLENTKIYYVTLEGNGKKLELIPVRKNGVGYMYDKVSGLLFGNLGTGSFILGPDIVEIEYLESSGTQYINLDYEVWNAGLSGEIVMQRLDDSTGEKAYIGRSVQGGFDLYTISNGKIGLWVESVDLQSNDTQVVDKNIHHVTFNMDRQTETIYLKVDNDEYSKSSVNFGIREGSNIQLFSHRGYYNVTGRIYSCKLWYDGIMIYDLIPVKIGQVGYMYDKLSNQLFGNSGSGEFLLGPDKT